MFAQSPGISEPEHPVRRSSGPDGTDDRTWKDARDGLVGTAGVSGCGISRVTPDDGRALQVIGGPCRYHNWRGLQAKGGDCKYYPGATNPQRAAGTYRPFLDGSLSQRTDALALQPEARTREARE